MSGTTTADTSVAIVGMSCRFAPDLDTPTKFWSALVDRRQAVSDMPERRWRPYANGSPEETFRMRATTLVGSYLDDIEGFDAAFFGISPKEAAYLDPQQRYMLELTWEALVSAGIPPLSLRDSDTGVYAAANSTDYGRRLLEDVLHTGAYAVNGTTDYGIANRVSYFLDLRGPSMAVNTACAASLTALDVACRSLRDGEIPLAIVGGMNIISSPALNVALADAGALALDGQSKSFDADADGYGRGEGAGVLVLKRLADAERDGDPVLALIRGGGVFQDGRSEGMMAPRAEAQAHMLRTCYQRAGVDPRTVSYVEAHGTGTPAGDGVELRALAEIVGTGREPAEACLIGSVKPNIGHVEGGSGIAGVIKVVLAMHHEMLPASLVDKATDAIDWKEAGLRLVAEATPWPRGDEPRRAGVSNYGVGGTIAHVILEEAPTRGDIPRAETRADCDAPPVVVPVSAETDAAVRALAGTTAAWLRDHDTDLGSVAHTLTDRRSHLRQRVAVAADNVADLVAGLEAFAVNDPHPNVTSGTVVAGADHGAVWVFSGHGAQWEGMGQGLLDTDDAFTQTIDALAQPFQDELGWTPRKALTAGGPWTASQVQALTFAMQCGLAESWRARGHEPAAIIGHSVGEIAANVVAGSLELNEAARFACRRAKALQAIAGNGAMAMASLSFDDATELLAGTPGVEAGIAASPLSTVVTGERTAVTELGRAWTEQGVLVQPIATDIAFHSSQVDEVLEEVTAGARHLTPTQPNVRLYTSALEDPRSDSPRDTVYWARNLRHPVRFSQATAAAIEDGYRVFVEVSSHPVVLHSVSEVAADAEVEIATVPTLRRGVDSPLSLSRHQAMLFCAGVDHEADTVGTLLALPGAAWQHRNYWIFDDSKAAEAGIGAGHDPARHSLVGGQLSVSGSPARQVWQTRVDLSSRPYPLDHELVGVEVTPAAVILNSFLDLATGDFTGVELNDVELRTPLAVVPPRIVQIVREGRRLSLSTRLADDVALASDAPWITHTTANLAPRSGGLVEHLDVTSLRDRLPEYEWATLEAMFERMGVGGYAFGWNLDELRRDNEEQLAVLNLEQASNEASGTWAHVIDAALTISATLVTPLDATTLWMSRSITSMEVIGAPPSRIVVHSRRTPSSPDDSVDVVAADTHGNVVAIIMGLRFASVENLSHAATPRELVHEITWAPLETVNPPGAILAGSKAPMPRSAVVLGASDRAGVVATSLRETGLPVQEVVFDPNAASIKLPAPTSSHEAVLLVLPDRPAQSAADAAVDNAALVMSATRAVLDDPGEPGTARHLWVLTHRVRAAHDDAAVAQATAWGAGRIVAGEHPEMWGGTVDVDPDTILDGPTLRRLLETTPGALDIVSVTADGLTSARLATIERAGDQQPIQCDPSGTVLITGGLGALGLEAAQWLAGRGMRRVVLAGRRALPPRSEWDDIESDADQARISEILDLEAKGVSVRTVALDVADGSAVARFLADHDAGHPPITGIIHAAGITHDALVDDVDRAALTAVAAPKVAGAWHLHEAFPVGSLDFFVMFSSCGQFARLSGQAAYAAANSALDALAALRFGKGEAHAVSLGWTSWEGVGMSAEIGTTMLEANTRGLGSVSVTEALQAWDFADRFCGPYKAVLRALPISVGMSTPPAFIGLSREDADAAEAGSLFEVDTRLDADDQAVSIAGEVCVQVAAELNLAPADLNHRRPLVELGVDSVMAVALRIRLQRTFGFEFPSTILWAKPTVHELGAFIHERLLGTVLAVEIDVGDQPLNGVRALGATR